MGGLSDASGVLCSPVTAKVTKPRFPGFPGAGKGLRSVSIYLVGVYKTVRQTLKRRIPDAMPSKERIPLYADKGYDSRAVRCEVWQAGYIDRISKRRVRLHRVVNRRRGVVERFFSWLDKERRLLMRFDTTIVAYVAWTWLACCKIMSKRLGQERAASKL